MNLIFMNTNFADILQNDSNDLFDITLMVMIEIK